MSRLGPLLASGVLVLALGVKGAAAQEPTVTRHALSNGIVLLVRENPAIDVVAASLQVRAGSHFETPLTAGITNFLQRVLLRGTIKRTFVQLAEASEDIGGGLDGGGEVESAELRGQALGRHWETLLAMIAEVALEPALPPQEIERERRLLLGQLKSRADSPFSFSFDSLSRDLYGPHPYGRHYLGLKENLDRLTREDLLAHYRAIYRPEQMVLAVSGKVERERDVKAAPVGPRTKRHPRPPPPDSAASSSAPPNRLRSWSATSVRACRIRSTLWRGCSAPRWEAVWPAASSSSCATAAGSRTPRACCPCRFAWGRRFS